MQLLTQLHLNLPNAVLNVVSQSSPLISTCTNVIQKYKNSAMQSFPYISKRQGFG